MFCLNIGDKKTVALQFSVVIVELIVKVGTPIVVKRNASGEELRSLF